MKNGTFLSRALVMLVLTSGTANGYELVTHSRITNSAITISSVGSSSALIQRLGFVGGPKEFDGNYYDFGPNTGNSVFVRIARDYEDRIIFRAALPTLHSVRGWITRGVIREDDGSTFVSFIGGATPTDDPYGNINRFCNHFLQPVTRSAAILTLSEDPINACPTASNFNAPNWAMGTVAGANDAFSSQPLDANSRNHFTVFAAREAMWRALTLTQRDGTAAPRPATLGQLPTWTKENDRKAYWATALRSLGDVLHTNQDMAQPQHTRNEGHGFGHAALLESYLDARAEPEAKTFDFDGEGKLTRSGRTLSDLVFSPYPVPRFARYSDYWSTHLGQESINQGKGLADYSSRGFFTPAKNLGGFYSGLPSPVNNEAAYTISTDAPSSAQDCTHPSLGRVQYAKGSLPNDFLYTETDPTQMTVRHASRSIFGAQWTMNRCVFDDRAKLLLGRAVAYSAGLIDYFFRGVLEVTPPDEGVYSLIDHSDRSGASAMATDAANGFKGFKTFRLKLRNATPDITPSGTTTPIAQTMSGGKLVGVLKFYRNLAHTDDLANEPVNATAYGMSRSSAEEIVVSSRVRNAAGMVLPDNVLIDNAATPQTYQFEFDQELPINAIDIKLQVVYRGVLGSEADAVVVETVDVSEPSYVTYLNSSDYIQLGNSVYTRSQVNDTPALLSQVRPTTFIDSMTGQLKNTSLVPIPLNFDVTFGSIGNNAKAVVALPFDKTYHRLALLIPPGGNAFVDWALTNSGCGYDAKLPVTGRVVQTNYTPNPAGDVITSPLPTTRNTRSWASVSCILNGDNLPHPDLLTETQNAAIAVLQGDNLKPLKFSSFTFGTP